jgi:hypothetical protein
MVEYTTHIPPFDDAFWDRPQSVSDLLDLLDGQIENDPPRIILHSAVSLGASLEQALTIAMGQLRIAAVFAREVISTAQTLPHLRLDLATATACYDVPLVAAARSAWEAAGERADAVRLAITPGAVDVLTARQRVPAGVLVVSAETAIVSLVERGLWASGETTDGALISVAEARRILGPEAAGLSDADVRHLRDQAEALARFSITHCLATATEAGREAAAERAAILEFDAGLSRTRAERRAQRQGGRR